MNFVPVISHVILLCFDGDLLGYEVIPPKKLIVSLVAKKSVIHFCYAMISGLKFGGIELQKMRFYFVNICACPEQIYILLITLCFYQPWRQSNQSHVVIIYHSFRSNITLHF